MKDSRTLDEELFSKAIDLPSIDRPDFIRRQCGSDFARVDRVLALLKGYENNSQYLETPPALAGLCRYVGAGTNLPPDHTPGDRVGRYRLTARIGEGGFGVVYQAEQEEPVRRAVAIKVIRLGLDTREFIARFDGERQALAMMDHPNIARVFDAGATESGRPFLVMELVHGIPITTFCDERNLPLAARLELFTRVCSAIQHAHQKGVIHRDLKPSNILVALDGTEAVPKVIDFGISKAIRHRLTEDTLLTHGPLLMGTPAYTSPEQMELSGLDVDTRSDIYSLGVLLYELLTGRQPFDRRTLERASLEEMRRLVREVDGPRPSERVATLTSEDRGIIAAQRGVEAAKLAGLLQSDLDWISMRCLEKDRTRRYETASDLALDIRRYLENQPVAARPPTHAYQLRKFVRRHRTGVTAGAAVALSVAGGLVTSSILLGRAQRAERMQTELRHRAEASAAEAQAEAAKSARVTQFMVGSFSSVAPSVALGRDTPSLVLDQAAARLDRELHDQPAVATKVRDILGVLYRDLGHYAKAEPLLREAVAARRETKIGSEIELAASLHNFGTVLYRLNRHRESEVILREALEIRRRILGADHPDIATTLDRLSVPVADLGHREEYESLRREALAMRRRLFGNEHPEVAASLYSLGTVARIAGDFAQSEAFFREALEIRRKTLGGEHPETADALNSLGLVLQAQDKLTEAVPAYREALGIRRKVLGETHPDTCVAFFRLVGLLPANDQREEAIEISRNVLAAQRRIAGVEAIETAPTLFALGALIGCEGDRAGESAEILQTARQLLARARSSGIQMNEEANYSLSYFAGTLYRIGDPQNGLVIADEARRSMAATSGVGDADILGAAETFARCQLAIGKLSEATVELERTLDRARRLPFPNRIVLRSLLGLGTAYRAAGRLPESLQMLEEAWSRSIAEGRDAPGRSLRDTNPSAIQCQLAWTLNQQRNYGRAEELLREILSRIESTAGRAALEPLAKSLLGESLSGQRRFAEAETFLLDGFVQMKRNENAVAGNRPNAFREAIDRIVQLYAAWEKPEQAVKWQATLVDYTAPETP
jgi:serine/threonine protein kinase/tetratricopeptide (TPR) repeat protein